MSVFYLTSGSQVVAKLSGKQSLYASYASSNNYLINVSENSDLDGADVKLSNLYFDGAYVKEKQGKPSDDAYWDVATTSWVENLSDIKVKQRDLINASRVAANSTSFEFAGKAIACDQLSRSDIDAINGLILLGGGFPAGFTNEWKAIDNTFVQIPDLATWTSFYGAMVALGIANFQKAQTKKAAIDAATTIPAVKAVVWEDPPPAPAPE